VPEEEELHVAALPAFLRRFSGLAVITCGLSRAVELLEKTREYEEAVALLRQLLDDQQWLASYRGHWHDRLGLDLDSHLRRPAVALAAVEAALADPAVRGGRRVTLCQRAAKVGRAKRAGEAVVAGLARLEARPDWDCPEAGALPTVTVQGRLVSKDGQSGTKSVFQVAGADGGVQFCSVEELVKLHYSSLGLPDGLHAEGAVFNSLLGLLLWEQIYADHQPDVFRGPGQALPLDWDSDSFYQDRREAVEARLAELRQMSRVELAEEVADRAAKYQGVVSLVAWSHCSPASLAALASCLGPAALAAVLGRMVEDHRATRAGIPDLTVWHPGSGEVRLVEVKGPGDRLSTKQILWIRFLNSVGVRAEVCHVLPTGSKGLVGPGSAPVPRGQGGQLVEGGGGQHGVGKAKRPRRKGIAVVIDDSEEEEGEDARQRPAARKAPRRKRVEAAAVEGAGD
jgi:Fanconi-associated nuclease 1